MRVSISGTFFLFLGLAFCAEGVEAGVLFMPTPPEGVPADPAATVGGVGVEGGLCEKPKQQP